VGLLVAAHTAEGQTVLVAQVGAGLTNHARRALFGLLRRIERKTPPVAVRLCPVVGSPRWVRPKYMGTVEYREFARDGLRHPSWKGLRETSAESISVLDQL
jgi:bifunctional non-homologous end joining protein LigD